jgi:hypothetical protein
MKISPLLLGGFLASAVLVMLWWRTGRHEPASNGIGIDLAQSKPSSDASAARLEASNEPHPREGAASPAHSSAPAPVQAKAPPTPATAPKQSLSQAEIAKATDEELEAEAKRLRKQVSEEAQPILDAQLARGQAEFLSTEQKYTARKEDASDICSINYVRDVGLYRVVLSREEYPDLYAAKAQALAIEKVLYERQLQAAGWKPGK